MRTICDEMLILAQLKLVLASITDFFNFVVSDLMSNFETEKFQHQFSLSWALSPLHIKSCLKHRISCESARMENRMSGSPHQAQLYNLNHIWEQTKFPLLAGTSESPLLNVGHSLEMKVCVVDRIKSCPEQDKSADDWSHQSYNNNNYQYYASNNTFYNIVFHLENLRVVVAEGWNCVNKQLKFKSLHTIFILVGGWMVATTTS